MIGAMADPDAAQAIALSQETTASTEITWNSQ